MLTVRVALPPREGWNAWMAEHGETDGTRRAILAVRDLEALGAEVRLVPADLADAASVRAVVAGAVAEWGGLHGVVHAAGAASGGPLGMESPERLAAALAPAVAGTLALDAATAGIPLDFFVLCSSLHALYGGPGALEHTAAGAFLDALRHLAEGAGSWRAGHAARAPWAGRRRGSRRRRAGRRSGACWSTGSGRGWRSARGTWSPPRSRCGGAHPRSPWRAPALHPRPAGAGAYVEPRSELEQTLAGMYAGALGIGRIGADDDFFEMGGDSLLATQLLSALNERFRVDLPLRVLFEAPTPGRLAVAIVQRQAEHVDDDLLAQVLAELAAGEP